MTRKSKALFLTLALAASLSGCTKDVKLEKVEGLDALGSIQVVSREEGSGTRSAFAQAVGFDTSTGDSADATTEDALICEDAEEVIAAVGEDATAIGYISMGAMDSLEGEKTLAIDGVEATLENVKNGSYELSRPFILAWTGTLSELEQDFLTYVLGKGQEIVGESYVTVDDATTFLSGKQSGTISIHGSTSAAPLLEELAAAYMEINPNATIEVTASDSTTGLNDAMQGKCDLGMASRELESYEAELLDYEVIAKDGMAVIVNEANPLSDVSLDELKSIFTGAFTDWGMINTGRED